MRTQIWNVAWCRTFQESLCGRKYSRNSANTAPSGETRAPAHGRLVVDAGRHRRLQDVVRSACRPVYVLGHLHRADDDCPWRRRSHLTIRAKRMPGGSSGCLHADVASPRVAAVLDGLDLAVRDRRGLFAVQSSRPRAAARDPCRGARPRAVGRRSCPALHRRSSRPRRCSSA